MDDPKLISDDQARDVLRRIANMYPDAEGSLLWDTRFHLVCAVLMSAQTTDKMVNRIMPKFTEDFPWPQDLASAPISEIEADINKLGLYHSKAKHLKAMAEMLVKDYHGRVPHTKAELVKLPGVGEKTASVVLSDGFGIPAIAVDTHVSRIAKRFKIVPQNYNPHQIQQRLQELLPKDEWTETHHAMIYFGRNNLPARLKDVDPYSVLK
ncbi:endonuclease III domain-containing protein [Lactobacillus corticis]|uniref:Endonuclease III n=1 Tax=Lactobacillus corticis TaxID=2201249 RepID=A0A916QKA1_9LACO|nr:endonuclease III [Lactobacillus corticis]GFZ27025.1 endonuclease III [Lactobacillus corticis]